MIKVLLADDFAIVRVLLRHVLEAADDMQVVAMAANGEEAVNEAVTHCPNVAVMDISMPTLDGVEATKQILTRCPQTRVLMVSTYHTPQHIHRSIEAGALGYVLKDDIRRDLVMAVRTLYQGGQYFSKQIAELARFYIDAERKPKTNTEMPIAIERLKNFKGNIPFLFLIFVISFISSLSI